jgi:hypothetical protein
VIDENAHFLHKNSTVTKFYTKWLCDPTLALEEELINIYSAEKVKELKSDLASVKI